MVMGIIIIMQMWIIIYRLIIEVNIFRIIIIYRIIKFFIYIDDSVRRKDTNGGLEYTYTRKSSESRPSHKYSYDEKKISTLLKSPPISFTRPSSKRN